VNARLLLRGAAAVAVTAALGLSASVAVEAGSTPAPHPLLAPMKAFCNTAVQRRLAVLGTDDTFVETSVALNSKDQTALDGQISTDEQGLTTLDQTIQGDTTTATAYAGCALIVTDYLVYVMEDPKIQEVMAADGVGKVNSTFETVIPELQQLIKVSVAAASVKVEAQTDLNDLTGTVGASRASISGVTASVINLVPSNVSDDATALESGYRHITTAGTDLAAARVDVNAILALLGG
jgi:hypothetical protein